MGVIEDLLAIPEILLVVKSGAAVAEIKSNGLQASCRNDWITIGDNDGPAHMHLNRTEIASVKFVQEEKPQRTSYGVWFMDRSGTRVLAAFFTKMYDSNMTIRWERLRLYQDLEKKWT